MIYTNNKSSDSEIKIINQLSSKDQTMRNVQIANIICNITY